MGFLAGMEQFISEHEPLAPHTWFGLGGAARWMARPQSVGQLSELVSRCRQENIEVYKLGLGANLLVSDDGVDGVVVRMNAPALRKVDWEPEADIDPACRREGGADSTLVRVGGGMDMNRLVLDSVRRGLTGLECMAGIPGTLGGAVRMNAGGRFGQIADVVRQVTVIDGHGLLRKMTAEQVGFRYRNSNLKEMIVYQAVLELQPGDADEIRRRFMKIWDYKKKSQPLGGNSAGCVFKNPPGESAGRLIDQAGLKGHTIGGASISTEHANFFLAQEGATTRDVLDLVGLARRRVAEKFGIELEMEIEFWGRAGSRTDAHQPAASSQS